MAKVRNGSAAARSVVVSFAAMFGIGSPFAMGQTVIEWAKPLSGSWHDPIDWVGGVVPNSPTVIARLAQQGAYQVNYSSWSGTAISVGGLEIVNPDAMLRLEGLSLHMGDAQPVSIVNEGTILSVGCCNAPPGGMKFFSDAEFVGQGTFFAGGKGGTAISIDAGKQLVNSASHTLSGGKFLVLFKEGSELVNHGTMDFPWSASGMFMSGPAGLRLETESRLVVSLLYKSQPATIVGDDAGFVRLDGLLELVQATGVHFIVGDVFVLIKGPPIEGEFAAVKYPAAPAGTAWRLDYQTNQVRLVLVCAADCDGDASLTIDDFVCFQTLFVLGEPQADCDGDGMLAIDDFVCFQSAFALGC